MLLIFDLLIALAYFAIPLELVYCFIWYPFPIRAKPAVICVLFVCFITLCGGTHLVRAFNLGPAIPIVTGICTVISVATALMLLWLIPGLFRLAKALEKDRVEKVMLDSLGGALKDAVEGTDEVKASLSLIRAAAYCSNRQLRLLTSAKASLGRMLGKRSAVDITSAEGLKTQPGKVVVPINQLFVIVVDEAAHAQHRDLIERASLQIAQAFRNAGGVLLV